MSDADQLSKDVLMQFTGSENWYRHGLNRAVLFTDGAKHVADAGGAYWLLDEIALAQRYVKAVAAEDFQCWRLTVNPDRTGILTCEDGNGHPVHRKALDFTDFPVAGVTLWFANNTIYLPSEH
jgi:hypothetical protein